MKKVFTIAWKDVFLTFRDRTALALILLTPFALTLTIGLAFGGFNRGSNAGLSHIPVVIVNHDPGQFGAFLVQVFQSPDLSSLLTPTLSADDAQARQAVDKDSAAAAVIIPPDFSESILPPELFTGDITGQTFQQQKTEIEIYVNPTMQVSYSVVRSIVDRFLNQIAGGSAGGMVTVTQLLEHHILTPAQLQAQGLLIGQAAGQKASNSNLITIKSETTAAQPASGGFDWLAYTAPSMAILFLMFTVTAGGRSILSERADGTLPRLLVTPSTAAQVLGGKALGIFLTGLAQMTILLVSEWLLFRLNLGSLTGIVVLLLALVFAASSWGLLIASYSRTSGQANAIGQAISLVFAAAAGNFVPRPALPALLRTASYISPNAWGLEGFGKLASGGALQDILPMVLALTGMGLLLFVVSTVLFRRQLK
jgi:ABC-2 type transport system permease protein